MDFFTDLMGLILLIVCILIVLIFLKDYIRFGGKKTTDNKKQKMIVYSAELSGDGKKRQSEKKKLVVENGNTWKAMHTVKLQSEVRLKADQFQVILDVENPGES